MCYVCVYLYISGMSYNHVCKIYKSALLKTFLVSLESSSLPTFRSKLKKKKNSNAKRFEYVAVSGHFSKLDSNESQMT